MRLIVVGLLLLLLLCACASFNQMESGLDSLMNKQKDEAFRVLGYPTTKQEFGGDTVYRWSIDSTGAVVIPKNYSTIGTYGSNIYYSNTITSQVVPVNYNCLIKLVAGTDGTLKQWEYRGNYDGCRPFMNRLADYGSQAVSRSDETVSGEERAKTMLDKCISQLSRKACELQCKNQDESHGYVPPWCN